MSAGPFARQIFGGFLVIVGGIFAIPFFRLVIVADIRTVPLLLHFSNHRGFFWRSPTSSSRRAWAPIWFVPGWGW